MRIEAKPAIVGLILLIVGAALVLPQLGKSGLWDPWEPRYVRGAEEMSARGDWLVPYYRDEPRLNRPPLSYWLIGFSHALAGSGEGSSRLPFALLALACPAALACAFAARGRPLEGALAGVALLASPQWLLLGRFAMPSSLLASCLGLLLALAVGIGGRELSSRAGRGAFFGVVSLLSAAALADFPRGLLLPAWAVLGWGLTRRDRVAAIAFAAVAIAYHAGQLAYSAPAILASYALALAGAGAVLVRSARVPRRVLVAGAGLVLLVVAPWFAGVAWLAGDELKVFNYKYGLNLGEDPGQHTGSYFEVLALVAAGGFWASAVAMAGFSRAATARPEPDGIARVVAGAAIGAFAFFVLSEARMGHFYVVLQPALAALAAVGSAWLLARRDWTAIPVGVAAIGLVWLIREEPSIVLETATVKAGLYGIDIATPATIAIVLSLVLLAAAWWARRPAWGFAALVPGLVFAGWVAQSVVPALAPKKSFEATWQRYLDEHSEGEPLALFDVSLDSAFYYARTSSELHDLEDVRDYSQAGGTRWLALPDKRVAMLEAFVPAGRIEKVEDTHRNCALVRISAPR